jgi:hypothetical protein
MSNINAACSRMTVLVHLNNAEMGSPTFLDMGLSVDTRVKVTLGEVTKTSSNKKFPNLCWDEVFMFSLPPASSAAAALVGADPLRFQVYGEDICSQDESTRSFELCLNELKVNVVHSLQLQTSCPSSPSPSPVTYLNVSVIIVDWCGSVGGRETDGMQEAVMNEKAELEQILEECRVAREFAKEELQNFLESKKNFEKQLELERLQLYRDELQRNEDEIGQYERKLTANSLFEEMCEDSENRCAQSATASSQDGLDDHPGQESLYTAHCGNEKQQQDDDANARPI